MSTLVPSVLIIGWSFGLLFSVLTMQQFTDFVVSVVLPRLGVILNFLGALLLALSFGRNIGKAYQEDEKGRRTYLASLLHTRTFWVGMILLTVGFFVSIIVGG